MEIKGCVCVVSGGASGLGEATVRHLLDKGSKVSILDIGEERGQTIASELGDSVIFCKTDVTNEESVQAAINKTMETFGAIHGAINCAGVGTPAKVLGKEGKVSMVEIAAFCRDCPITEMVLQIAGKFPEAKKRFEFWSIKGHKSFPSYVVRILYSLVLGL